MKESSMVPNPEDILVALLSLNSIYRRRISPQIHHNLLRFVRDFFKRQIDFFGYQHITYPLVQTSLPTELAIDTFVREEYIASRHALFSAWSDNPLQWDATILNISLRQSSLPLPSVITQINQMWDMAFFTNVRMPSLKVASLVWFALAYQNGLKIEEPSKSEEITNPFVIMAEMVSHASTFQANVLNTVNKYNRQLLKSFCHLQQSAKYGIEWVVGVRRFLLRWGIDLMLLRILSEQELSDQLEKQVRAMEDSLDERCADLGQTISVWPTTVKYIFNNVVKLSQREKQCRIDYWYSRGHIPEFTRQALTESTLSQPQDCLHVPPIYINAVKLVEGETQEHKLFQMIDDKEELERFTFDIISGGTAVHRGTKYSLDELFPNDEKRLENRRDRSDGDG